LGGKRPQLTLLVKNELLSQPKILVLVDDTIPALRVHVLPEKSARDRGIVWLNVEVPCSGPIHDRSV
jgi:hypothetical protein